MASRYSRSIALLEESESRRRLAPKANIRTMITPATIKGSRICQAVNPASPKHRVRVGQRGVSEPPASQWRVIEEDGDEIDGHGRRHQEHVDGGQKFYRRSYLSIS